MMKALRSRSGEVVESWQEKAEITKEEAFPKPLKGVERKAEEEGGEMWKKITDEDIREALFNQSVQKAHQQKTFPAGRDGSVRVHALCQSRHRLPGGGLFRARRQYHASHGISPSDRCFAISSCSVGLLF